MLAQAGCASCAKPPHLLKVIILPKPDRRPLVCSYGVAYTHLCTDLSLCAGSNCCPLTGVPLKGWVMLVSNEGLRCGIQAWVRRVGLDLDDLADAAYKSTDASSACADMGRSGVGVDASAVACAGRGSGAPCAPPQYCFAFWRLARTHS